MLQIICGLFLNVMGNNSKHAWRHSKYEWTFHKRVWIHSNMLKFIQTQWGLIGMPNNVPLK